MNDEELYTEIELLSFALQNGSTKSIDDEVDASYFKCDEHQFLYALFNSYEKAYGGLSPVAVLEHFEMNSGKLLTDFFQTEATAELGQQIFEHLAFLGGYTNYSFISIGDQNDSSEKELTAQNSQSKSQNIRILSFRESFDEFIAEREKSGLVQGLKTGLSKLDAELGGFVQGTLTVLGAEPGMGKSFLVQQTALNNATAGESVGLLSLEIKKSIVMQRILSMAVGIEHLETKELLEIRGTQPSLLDLPIFIYSKVRLIDEIEELITMLVKKAGIKMLIIDYLQLIESDRPWHSRTECVGDVLRRIAMLGRELNLVTIVISSLTIKSMAQRNQRIPGMMDFRDSGDISYDADNILFLWKPLPKDATYREIIIPKIQFGSPSDISIPLRFDMQRLMFRETEKQKGGERMWADPQSYFKRRK